MIKITDYIKEQRHIFGICPCCNDVFRLSDVKLSYKAKYKPDWLDAVEKLQQKIENSIERFEERKKEIRMRAIEEARRKVLPKILNRAVPFFAKRGIYPQDIKTILNPIDFVAFHGMTAGNVKSVLLLDSPATNTLHQKIQHSIQEAIKNDALDWVTVKVTEEGVAERQEQLMK